MTFEERIDRLAERQTALHRTLELAIKSKQSPTERTEDLLRRNEAEMVRLRAFIDRIDPGSRD
jgi:hypothetical protein